MIALNIPDVKVFMAKLLREGTFDSFELRSLIIDSFARFEINGAAPTKEEGFCTWGTMRKYAFDIIKGESAPRAVKAVLGLNAEKVRAGFPNSAALFVNIIFEGGKITLITGQSPKSFSLDKSDEEKWDGAVRVFLTKNNIIHNEEINTQSKGEQETDEHN